MATIRSASGGRLLLWETSAPPPALPGDPTAAGGGLPKYADGGGSGGGDDDGASDAACPSPVNPGNRDPSLDEADTAEHLAGGHIARDKAVAAKAACGEICKKEAAIHRVLGQVKNKGDGAAAASAIRATVTERKAKQSKVWEAGLGCDGQPHVVPLRLLPKLLRAPGSVPGATA